jgi:transposase-like protein
MAWSDQCKVAFEMTVIAKKNMGEKRKSERQVLRDVASETDIPFKTLERWWTEAKSKRLKNEANDETAETTTETPKLEKLEKPKHGGARPGAGRKPKKSTGDARSDIDLSRINGALHFATVAIACLEKIPADDPRQLDAYHVVLEFLLERIASSMQRGYRRQKPIGETADKMIDLATEIGLAEEGWTQTVKGKTS